MNERIHHDYSPSTLGNLEVCPCYEGRQSTTPHERTTAGTRAHDVVESGIDDAKLGDDDAIAAAECLDFVNTRRQLMEGARDRALDGYQRAHAGAPPEILELKEIYLPIDDKTFLELRTVQKTDELGRWIFVQEQKVVEATTAGYVDRVLIDHTRTYAEMFDWKFGMWPVDEAATNPQGIAYVLGLFRMYPTLLKVHVYFKQPHLELTSDAVFTRDDIPALYLRIQTIVARAREARKARDFASANPTVPGCNFCANIGRCPAVAAFACKVGNKFHPLAIPADITPTMVLSGSDTTLAMRLSQVVGVWAQAFRTQTTDRVLRGDAPIPRGYELTQRSNREVVNESMFKQVALTGYLTKEEYDKIAPVPGFGAIEDVIKEKTPRGQKKAAIEEFQKTLEDSGAVRRGDPYTFLRAIPEKNAE